MKLKKDRFTSYIFMGLQSLFILWLCAYGFFIAYSHLSTRPEVTKISQEPVIILTGDSGRITQGLELAKTIDSPAIFITGVNEQLDKKDILNNWNADNLDPLISIDHKALNTIGNIEQSVKWLQENNYNEAVIVTSNYHMPRAEMLFKAKAPELHFLSYPVQSSHLSPQKLKFWKTMFIEFHKTALVKFCIIQNLVDCLDE